MKAETFALLIVALGFGAVAVAVAAFLIILPIIHQVEAMLP